MERVDGDDRTISELRAALEDRERELVDKEGQLERYALDLRDTFKRERARGQELASSYVATVRALANAVEARDAYTGQHAERVAAYGLALADAAGLQLDAGPQVEFGFLLHDIGKVAVPDAILFKAGQLERHERELMQRHAMIGWEILRDVHWLGDAKLVVRHHHERWDGAGYPDGLAGDAIPPAARVFAVADTLDAITTDRPYRRAASVACARRVIAEESGRQFDPAVVAALAALPDAAIDELRRAHG